MLEVPVRDIFDLEDERARRTDESPELDVYEMLSDTPTRGRGNPLGRSWPSALEALWSNKGRGILTALGIIIGVTAVIVMVSLGQGASVQVNNRLAGLGTDVLTINPGSARSGGIQSGAGTVSSLKAEDVQAIQTEVPG